MTARLAASSLFHRWSYGSSMDPDTSNAKTSVSIPQRNDVGQLGRGRGAGMAPAIGRAPAMETAAAVVWRTTAGPRAILDGFEFCLVPV